MDNRVTRSQKCADLVFKEIQSFVDKKTADHATYKSLCKRSGGLLRTLGLMQFLILLRAKGAKMEHYKFLLEHLQKELNSLNALQSKDVDDLIQKLLKEELPSYMKLAKTVLLLLQWHKRIAEILIEAEAAHADEAGVSS